MNMMTLDELDAAIREGDWATVGEEAEVVAIEGDTYWYVCPLEDGQWAAFDDESQYVEVFPTRLAAVAAQWQGWLDSYENYNPESDDTSRFGWYEPSEWLTVADVAYRYRLPEKSIEQAIRDGIVHSAALDNLPGGYIIRAEEAERLWA